MGAKIVGQTAFAVPPSVTCQYAGFSKTSSRRRGVISMLSQLVWYLLDKSSPRRRWLIFAVDPGLASMVVIVLFYFPLLFFVFLRFLPVGAWSVGGLVGSVWSVRQSMFESV